MILIDADHKMPNFITFRKVFISITLLKMVLNLSATNLSTCIVC